MKTCPKCKNEKEESLFGKNKRNKDGLSNRCRLCSSELSKKFYSENKERVIEKSQRYYLKNKESINKKTRLDRINNPEKAKEQDKKARLKKKEYERKYKKDWRVQNKQKIVFYGTKYKLKKKIGIEPTNELVETIVLISQTKQLCRTLNN